LTQKNQKVKENLKARRWSFVAQAYAIRATTITPVITQEAAPPNFPLPRHIINAKLPRAKADTQYSIIN
jgi:transposase